MSKKISFFAIFFLLMYRANFAISIEVVPTLNEIKQESSRYHVDTPFSLQTTQSVGDASVVLDGATYYFNPQDDSIARILASTPAKNLILTSQNNAIFEHNGQYYTFDSEAIPSSAFIYTSGTETNHNFSVIESSDSGDLTRKFYKISFPNEDNKILLGTSPRVSWQEVSGADADVVQVALPKNDTKYFQYTYIPQVGRTIYNTSQETLSGDVDADFIGIMKSGSNGGAIYNDQYQTIGNITGDFIGNKANYGGAIAGDRYSEIGNITGDFIKNTSNQAGGAIYISPTAKIASITGNFIGNTSSSFGGGAIYLMSISSIGEINGNFIGNISTSNFGGAIHNYAYSKIANITGDFIGNAALSNGAGAIYNYSEGMIGNITGDFIGNYSNSQFSSVYGGAIYNNDRSIIDSITGNFIKNYISGASQAYGGAIANFTNSKIESINANFIENKASSTSSEAYGGAIYNNGSEIGNIKGSFISNSVVASVNSSVYAGAIYTSSGTIGNIIGDFFENTVTGNSSYGGAIYTSSSNVGVITGNFVQNHVSGNNSSAYGGAITNYNASKIEGLNGDFIKNYASSTSSGAYGGAIANNNGSEIGDIKGSFIGNYASANSNYSAYGGAIDNSNGKIASITGDFIENHVAGSSAYGGAIYSGISIGDITGDFVRNHAIGSYAQGGAIHASNKIGNIVGNFIENYASGSSYIYGGAIYSTATFEKIDGDFIRNYAQSSDSVYGGAIYNSSIAVINNLNGNFVENYVKSGTLNAHGGAIHNDWGNINNITGDFIGNYASSEGLGAHGGAIFLRGNISFLTTLEKKSILFENNKTITQAGSSNEVSKLNSINIGATSSSVNFNTIADSYVNIRDPMTSFDFSGNFGNFGEINKTGEGALYLWGDNSEFGGIININEGDFAALFAEAEDLINDPLGQRQTFNLSNATINFADNTTFRPMVTNNKIAKLDGSNTIGDNVNLRPYNVSSLEVGSHTYDVDYSNFVGMENDLIKVDTTGTDLNVDLKRDLKGYEGMGAAVDAYRKLTTLSVAERAIFDNIYYTGEVSQEIKDKFIEEINVVSGEDIIIYNEVHKASIRQFSRQIYSRVQNKNCPSCGMTEGYSDQHLWFNVGKNFIDKDTKGTSLGYKYEPTSLAFGYDHDIIPNALNMGVAVSYAFGDVKGKGKSIYNTAEIDEYMIALYWKYKPLRAYVTGSVGGGYMNNKTKLQGSTIDVTGKYETRAAFANFEFGYDFGNACGVLEPFVGFEYAYIYNKAYTEKGLGARHFASSDYNSIELPIGFRVSRNMVVDSYIVTPSIELAYSRSLGDRSSEVESYFVSNAGSPWVMRGASESRDSIRSGLNLKLNNIYNPFALNLGYARDTRSGYSDDQLYLTVRYNF